MDVVNKILGCNNNIIKCELCDGDGLDENMKTCKKCLGMGSYAKNQ